MNRIRVRLLVMGLGAICFWLPVTAVSLVTQRPLHFLVGMLLPPTTFMLGYAFFRNKRPLQDVPRSASLWMLLGVLIFGPWFLGFGLIPTKGGFYHFQGWTDIGVIVVSMFFPIWTLMFAQAHGTHNGMLLAAALTIVIQSKLERKQPVNK